MKHQKTQQGFTLIELIVVVALLGILLATGISSFASTIQRSAIKAVSDDIAGTISSARMSALVNGSRTTVCVVPDITALTATTACVPWTTLAAGTSNGSIGMIVFRDDNADNILNNLNNLISTSSFDDRSGKAGITIATTNTALQFTRQGYLASPGTTFRIVSSSASYAGTPYDREIIVAANIGRICTQIAPSNVSPGPGCLL